MFVIRYFSQALREHYIGVQNLPAHNGFKTISALGCLLIAGALAQQPLSPTEREAHWQQDLKALAAALKAPGIRIEGGIATRGQKDFADVYPNFDADIASLTEAVPTLTDAEVYLRIRRLIARARIGHNTIDIPAGMGFLNRLPVDFRWYAGDLAISAANSKYSELLGARVIAIGGKTPEQFLADLAPYVSYENESWLRVQSTNLMPARGVLLHFSMLGADQNVALRLEKIGGAIATVSMPVTLSNEKKITIDEALRIPDVLYRRHPDSWYWFRYLTDSQTLFVQYNRCANDSTHQFGDIAVQALREADAHAVRRTVIDLRWNGGGNSRVINPLISGLAARRKAFGHVYVLIGPHTFSSAVDNAISLRKDLSATLVGEPSGGAPDGYGEVSTFTLPNSKLTVRFTTKRWGPKGGGDNTVTPDLPAAFKLADFIAGRDPALDAAIGARN